MEHNQSNFGLGQCHDCGVRRKQVTNPTSNYNFQMPTSTDLVTDLPADFEVFGQAVDTQMKTNADAATQKATLTTKGDIYAATGTSTPARLAIGSTDQVLTADSSTATGLKWATAASGGMTLISTVNASAATGVSFTSIAGTYKHLLLVWEQVRQSAFSTFCTIRFNSNTTAAYSYSGVRYRNDTAYPGQTWDGDQTKFGSGTDFAPIMATDTADLNEFNCYGRMWIYDYAQSDKGIVVDWNSMSKNGADNNQNMAIATGHFQPATLAAVTQIDVVRNSTQTITGTFKLYGVS
jgi:hypothetical protein